MGCWERVERAKGAIIIRYTLVTHGQGDSWASPVSKEPFSWGGVGRDQHFSQHSCPWRSVNRRTWVTRW